MKPEMLMLQTNLRIRVYLHCCPIKTLSIDGDAASWSFWWGGLGTEKRLIVNVFSAPV